jgi:hypothetical protein
LANPADLMRDPPPCDLGVPVAEIEQVGHWIYRIAIIHGMMSYGPDGYGWHRPGRGRAERKGRRELARYLRKEERRANRWQLSGERQP